MRAIVKTAPGVGHVEPRNDWPQPSGRQGWVVIDVAYCGICGTDLHICRRAQELATRGARP